MYTTRMLPVFLSCLIMARSRQGRRAISTLSFPRQFDRTSLSALKPRNALFAIRRKGMIYRRDTRIHRIRYGRVALLPENKDVLGAVRRSGQTQDYVTAAGAQLSKKTDAPYEPMRGASKYHTARTGVFDASLLASVTVPRTLEITFLQTSGTHRSEISSRN